MYDINTHPDFKRYFDTAQKRNYWVLGYFGGGSLNVLETYALAKQMAEKLNLPLETIHIDEIHQSRRHKNFKYMYSSSPKQTPEPECKMIVNNVFAWLTD
jgi:hypothetical protein